MKKTPITKKYLTSSTNKDLRDLLTPFLGRINRYNKQGKDEVFKQWFVTIGREFSSYTQPISYEKGVLVVKVQGSTLYNLFCTYEKPRLLQELRKKIPLVRDIQFRFG